MVFPFASGSLGAVDKISVGWSWPCYRCERGRKVFSAGELDLERPIPKIGIWCRL